MVVQVDETRRDHRMSIDNGCICGKFHLRAQGNNFALTNQDGSILDNARRSDQSAAQGVALCQAR